MNRIKYFNISFGENYLFDYYRFIILIFLIAGFTSRAQNIAYLEQEVSFQSDADIKLTIQPYSFNKKSNNPFKGHIHQPQKVFNPLSLGNSIDKPGNVPNQLIDGTYWLEESNINKTRLYSVLGSIMVVDIVGYIYQRNVWRQEHTTGMHSINWWVDVHNYQRMDKIGHFMDAYFVGDLTSKLYRWSGVSGESSIWYGALTGWLWMLEIEISDGFFADWGFSWLDLSANTVGSAFFILQQYYPEVLGGIHPKISYHVSKAWKDKTYTKNPRSLIDDYEGMTFWFAINPHHYFPDSWKKNYPDWLAPLGIAIGYGAIGIAPAPQFGKPEWYVGLDIDLRKIPVGNDSGLWKFIKSEFNFLRLPLPAIRFTPSGIWYGIYF